MPLSIGPTIGVKGEKAFRSAFQEMIAQGSRLKSEMDLLTASFSKNDTAEQRLTATSSKLTQQIQTQQRTADQANQMLVRSMDSVDRAVKLYDAQVKKVDELTKAHEEHTKELSELASAYGENDERVQKAREEWAAEEAELDKANKTLGEREAAVYKQQATTEKWNEVLVTNTTRLEQMRRELVKGANYVEEFGRKSEESKRNVEKHEKALEVLDSELERQLSSYSKLERYLLENARNRETLIKKIEEEKKVVADNTKLHDEAVKTEEKQRKEYERLVKELENAKKQYGENSLEAKRLNDEVDEQAKLVHQAEMNTADYTKAVNDAVVAQRELETELKNSSGFATMGKVMSDVGEKMADFGNMMSTYVTAPLAALGTYAVKSASDFEDAMAKIYTIAIDSTEPMEKMHDELIALSNETGFDLSDLGEAAYQTVSASVDAADAVEFLTQATKLARAGFTSTEKSVDILSTIMNSYGKEVYDTAYLSDLLIKTQNDGKLVVDQLAHSIGTVVPMAKNYGVGIEQIAAAYATMTKQGTSAEQATTFMRALFTELEKKGKGVSKILEDETGKSFAQLMKSGWSLADVLEVLYTKTDKDSEAYQLLFKNVRSGNAAASLAAQGFGVLRSELDAMNNVAGQTEKALAVLETPSLRARKAVNRLKNSAEDLGETLMDIGMPAFENITDKVTELTEGFVKLQPETKRVIAKGIGLAAAIGPVATVTGKLVGYIGALMAGTGSVIPLIVGLTAGFVGMYTAAEAAAIEERHMREEQWGLSEETKQLIEDVNGLKTAHNEFKVSMQSETTELLNTKAKAQELALQYDALLDSEGNVKKGNEELADYLMTELATALGINKEDLQNLVSEHGNLSKSIQQTIADYEKEAYASIYKQELNEATERLVKSQMAEKDLVEQQDQAYANLRATAHEMQLAKDAITDAEAKGIPVTEEMYQAYDDASKNWDIAKQAVDNLDGAITESRTNQQEAKKDVDTYSAALKDLAGKSDETAEQIKSDAKESETSVKNAVDNSVSKMTAAKWDAYKSGENFARGYANGIDDYAYLSASAASNMGANATKLLKISQHEKSPSKITRQSGRYFGEGYALGMKDRFPMVNAMAEKMGEMATDSLAYGSYLPEGAIGGSYSSSKTVNAPISLNVTVNGSVDDPDSFAKDIANRLTNLINRESEVFA